MPGAGAFHKPMTTVEAVLLEVRRALLEGDYPAGARLNVDAISKQLGTSRAPVRDALRILEGEQQVVYEAHRGYLVPEMGVAALFDLYRSRELLEAEAVAHAVPALSDEALASLRAHAATITRALDDGDRVAATYANRDFHFGLFASPDHEQLVVAITSMWNADAYRSVYLRDLDAARTVAGDHAGIAEAAGDRDVAAVIRLQNEHRDHELALLLAAMGEETAGTPWHSALTYRPRKR